MKKEILMLIIGILVGAVITTGVFLVLKGNQNNQINRGEPPTSINGNNMDSGRVRGNPNEKNTLMQEGILNSNEIDS